MVLECTESSAVLGCREAVFASQQAVQEPYSWVHGRQRSRDLPAAAADSLGRR